MANINDKLTKTQIEKLEKYAQTIHDHDDSTFATYEFILYSGLDTTVGLEIYLNINKPYTIELYLYSDHALPGDGDVIINNIDKDWKDKKYTFDDPNEAIDKYCSLIRLIKKNKYNAIQTMKPKLATKIYNTIINYLETESPKLEYIYVYYSDFYLTNKVDTRKANEYWIKADVLQQFLLSDTIPESLKTKIIHIKVQILNVINGNDNMVGYIYIETTEKFTTTETTAINNWIKTICADEVFQSKFGELTYEEGTAGQLEYKLNKTEIKFEDDNPDIWIHSQKIRM